MYHNDKSLELPKGAWWEALPCTETISIGRMNQARYMDRLPVKNILEDLKQRLNWKKIADNGYDYCTELQNS